MICTNCKKRVAKIQFAVLQDHVWCKRCFYELMPALGNAFREEMLKSAKPYNMKKKEAKELETMLLLTK